MATIPTNDSMWRALNLVIYPANTEDNVGALLQKYRDDQNIERWEDYVAFLHEICNNPVKANQPNQPTFADAANVAWAWLDTTV